MGCCLSRDQSSLADSEELEGQIGLGKSRPLLQERLKWRSDVAITEGQLRSKRDEFWETAPAFEGRKEIWDALRAACAQAEQGDWAMAQAILDGASVVLPDGTLRESYDELGNRYQVPIYCLFSPINLVEAKSESSVASKEADAAVPAGPVSTELPPGGRLVELRLRLSNAAEGGGDLSLEAKTTETIGGVKRRLAALRPDDVPADPGDQRWYTAGRYLHDKATVQEASIPRGFVVQVIIRSPEDCPVISTAAALPKKAKKAKKKREKKEPKEATNGAAATATEASHSGAAASLQPSTGEEKSRPGTRESQSQSSLQLSSLSATAKDPPPVE